MVLAPPAECNEAGNYDHKLYILADNIFKVCYSNLRYHKHYLQ